MKCLQWESSGSSDTESMRDSDSLCLLTSFLLGVVRLDLMVLAFDSSINYTTAVIPLAAVSHLL